MREIPIKNYFILIIIIIVVALSTIILTNIYNNRFKTTSIMYNYLSEIKKNDIDTYLLEKPNTILYIADKYDITNNKIEEKLKEEIIKYNAKDYFVYLNINTNNIEFIDKLNQKYSGNINKQFPVLVIIEDGLVSKSYTELNNINLKELTGDMK